MRQIYRLARSANQEGETVMICWKDMRLSPPPMAEEEFAKWSLPENWQSWNGRRPAPDVPISYTGTVVGYLIDNIYGGARSRGIGGPEVEARVKQFVDEFERREREYQRKQALKEAEARRALGIDDQG